MTNHIGDTNEMVRGETCVFKSLSEFEATEGKITGFTVFGRTVIFYTKTGVYKLPKKDWEKLQPKGASEK